VRNQNLVELFLNESGAAPDVTLLTSAIQGLSHTIVQLILNRADNKCALIEQMNTEGGHARQEVMYCVENKSSYNYVMYQKKRRRRRSLSPIPMISDTSS